MMQKYLIAGEKTSLDEVQTHSKSTWLKKKKEWLEKNVWKWFIGKKKDEEDSRSEAKKALIERIGKLILRIWKIEWKVGPSAL